jgi:hypothetical protein
VLVVLLVKLAVAVELAVAVPLVLALAIVVDFGNAPPPLLLIKLTLRLLPVPLVVLVLVLVVLVPLRWLRKPVAAVAMLPTIVAILPAILEPLRLGGASDSADNNGTRGGSYPGVAAGAGLCCRCTSSRLQAIKSLLVL